MLLLISALKSIGRQLHSSTPKRVEIRLPVHRHMAQMQLSKAALKNHDAVSTTPSKRWQPRSIQFHAGDTLCTHTTERPIQSQLQKDIPPRIPHRTLDCIPKSHRLPHLPHPVLGALHLPVPGHPPLHRAHKPHPRLLISHRLRHGPKLIHRALHPARVKRVSHHHCLRPPPPRGKIPPSRLNPVHGAGHHRLPRCVIRRDVDRVPDPECLQSSGYFITAGLKGNHGVISSAVGLH